MNCQTHNIPMRYYGTIADIYICPKCMNERQAGIDPQMHTVEIPWAAIRVSELSLFTDAIVDGDKKVVIVRERI